MENLDLQDLGQMRPTCTEHLVCVSPVPSVREMQWGPWNSSQQEKRHYWFRRRGQESFTLQV